MDYTLVENDAQLQATIDAVAAADVIGMDTEFVAEDCYQPDLCLLQVSTREEVFIVDPRHGLDVTPLWELMTDGERTVIVHAGREEILFAFRVTGKPITRLFDIQVASGLLGGEFPASYGKLLQRLVGETAPKGETRTDWRERPLSAAQLDYAAIDVLHLPRMYDILTEQLKAASRLEWLEDELHRRQTNLLETQQQEGWSRLSGVQSLRGKQLGACRELWRWRDDRARQRDMPARRVLRDDLIIELSRRGVTDTRRIGQIRGLHHSGFQRFLPEIAECVRRGQEGKPPTAPWSRNSSQGRPPALLQQFMTAALSFLCRTNQIATTIVGTSDDVGKLLGYWMRGNKISGGDMPLLLTGWRKELAGEPLHEIFTGKRALRVVDPKDEMPLGLCEYKDS